MPDTLFDRCSVNTNLEDDTFVGIKIDGEGVKVHFPLGFHFEHDSENELRQDILMMIQVIGSTVGREESELKTESYKRNETSLPIQAYLYLIQDFFVRGYYKDTEIHYIQGRTGKIDWGRTIKTQKASIQDNEVFYLDTLVRKNQPKDNELITLIHKYCVYQSFRNIGWLFTSAVPEKPEIEFNRNLFKTVVLNKLSNTFNDRNRQLFINMIAIIDSLGDNNASSTFLYGTYRFEYVWEKLVDRVYGIKDKQAYFPKTEWHIKNKPIYDNSSLEPDSIMLFKGNVFILDAKYYKFGWTHHTGDLPQSASINKQITYGEYVAKQRSENGEQFSIYNAFIMPFDSNNEYWRGAKTSMVVNIGEAISRWKNNNNEFEKIQGILVDTKHLMKIVTEQDKSEIVALANAICEKFD